MGLDTTHDCWHGAYSAFSRWRVEIARVAGMPPLEMMEGFIHDGQQGIKWEILKPDVLHVLLNHSDCDGHISWRNTKKLADRLAELLPLLEGDGGGHIGSYREKTQIFIDGLLAAHEAHERVEFH